MGMSGARVISLNRGREADLLIGGKPARSAIDKRPVAGPVAVSLLGLDGDECADQEFHGGFEQAVYAYAREDLDWWTEQLSRELPSGMFGENVTTAGIDVSAPSIVCTDPVMYAAASEQRKTTSFPTSVGAPRRCMGTTSR